MYCIVVHIIDHYCVDILVTLFFFSITGQTKVEAFMRLWIAAG